MNVGFPPNQRKNRPRCFGFTITNGAGAQEVIGAAQVSF
jgi:hypothetical protein